MGRATLLSSRGLLLGGLIAFSAGCASGGGAAPRNNTGVSMAAEQPLVSIERFLEAANARDLATMAMIFGTASGSMAATEGCEVSNTAVGVRLDGCNARADIERQMDILATLLRHDQARVGEPRMVAGAEHPSREFGVTLVRGNDRFENVPFTTVQTSQGTWMVEKIDLLKITGGGSAPR